MESVTVSEQPNFQIEEYKSLRVEIDNIQKQAYAIDTAITVGFASVIAFSSDKEAKLAFLYALLFLSVTTFAIFKRFFLSKRMKVISGYIKLIESKHRVNHIIGWEHFLSSHENSSRCNKGLPTRVFYSVMFTMTFLYMLFKVHQLYC
jgi:hypothetical protein